MAYSRNGGKTWTQATWPSNRSACGEAEVTVNAQGVFYLDSSELGCPAGVTEPYPGYCDSTLNYTIVSRSTDGGATWSAPVETPLHVAARAHLQVDMKTGKLYALGGQDFLLPGAISVSSDQGRTWSTPVPSVPDAPTCTPIPLPGAGCGPDPFLAVDDRILATTEEGPAAVMFNSSRNDGATFTAYPVTDSAGTPVPSSAVSSAEFPYSEPLIAADPSRPGRFAILIPRGDPNAFQVYVTDDAGRTWHGPTEIPAANAFMPAIAGDHQSGIALADGYLYVTWSDGQDATPPDATNGIFARLPLSAFQHAR